MSYFPMELPVWLNWKRRWWRKENERGLTLKTFRTFEPLSLSLPLFSSTHTCTDTDTHTHNFAYKFRGQESCQYKSHADLTLYACSSVFYSTASSMDTYQNGFFGQKLVYFKANLKSISFVINVYLVTNVFLIFKVNENVFFFLNTDTQILDLCLKP